MSFSPDDFDAVLSSRLCHIINVHFILRKREKGGEGGGGGGG